MLRQIIQRFRVSAAWRAEHKESFLAEAARNDAGLTQFQLKCLQSIAIAHPSLSFGQKTHEDGTVMLVANLTGEDEQLYVYENEAGIFGNQVSLPLEEWDFKSPTELRSSLIQVLAKRLERTR